MNWHTTVLIFNPMVLVLIFLQIFAFKRQFIRGNYFAGPNILYFSDLSLILYGSLVLLFPLVLGNSLLNGFFVALVFVFSLYLAIAVQIYMKHFYHLNIKTVCLGILNYKEVFSGDDEMTGAFFDSLTIDTVLFPVLVSWVYALVLFSTHGFGFVYALTFLYLFLLGIKISVARWQNALLLIILSWVLYKVGVYNAGSLSSMDPGLWLYVSFALMLIVLKLIGLKSDSCFFNMRSAIGSLFVVNPLRQSAVFDCRSEDQEIIEPDLFPQDVSQYFGLCSGANVILITLESVSASYVKPYCEHGVDFRYFNELAKKSWVSDYHVCASPNTNTSFLTMYQGNYFKNPENYTNHLNILKDNAYTPLYLTTSPTTNNPVLMESIGIEKSYFPGDELPGRRPDKEIFSHLLKQVSQEYAGREKLFLHLKNLQTHIPYRVYNVARPNNLFDRFNLAVEQVDAMLPELIEEIGGLVDLNNTIIVYTGDHGQSFGEMNYKMHSNSVIKPQVNVPFLISHPKLQSRKIAYSSHFDLMPTLFDLLGIRYSSSFVGNSLGHDEVPFSHVLFSETRCGNLPSCFGHINKRRKLLFDVSLESAFTLDLDDNVIASLSGDELHYHRQLMLRALRSRGLVARSANSRKWA